LRISDRGSKKPSISFSPAWSQSYTHLSSTTAVWWPWPVPLMTDKVCKRNQQQEITRELVPLPLQVRVQRLWVPQSYWFKACAPEHMDYQHVKCTCLYTCM